MHHPCADRRCNACRADTSPVTRAASTTMRPSRSVRSRSTSRGGTRSRRMLQGSLRNTPRSCGDGRLTQGCWHCDLEHRVSPDWPTRRRLAGHLPRRLERGRLSPRAPIRLLPLGVPHVILIGEYEDFVPRSLTEAYARAATRAGDRVQVRVIPGVGHFEIASPRASQWPQVESTIRSLLEGNLPPEGTTRTDQPPH